MTTITNNKLTDEEITALALKLFDGSSFYFQSGRRPGAKTMAELLNKAASAVAELQERRRTDNQEPAPERERIRREHAEWSDATFGDVGPIGPLKHLSKEALEAAAEPDDLSEWADMQFLLWDAQRRADITDEQITQAMTEKLAINKTRQWPEPKDGEPRLHIKEQPVPVVPEKMSKHALFEVAIARFSKMNEGFPIKRFKADWVISWMLENFPPVAQKQGDN
ncbi:TPA: DUF550 domain-containing protein [Salmonella enterica subsp. enterica serovar Newport]